MSLKNFLLYLEQTIQAAGNIQEKDKNQGLLSKEMERENLNMRGYYSDQLKNTISKPYVDEIHLKSGEYKKIEKEIKDRDEDSKSPSLFSQISMRKNLGLKTKQQMRNDLNQVYSELEELKQNSSLQDTYRNNLRIILRKFFTFGKISSRYVILPLSTTIPSDAMIRALNTSNNKGTDILNYTRQHREIITDVMDEDIEKYMTDNGYHFKNKNDLYDNICYTKNNAKINLLDELKKINANVKNIDSKKKILEKMPPNSPNRKAIEDEIRKLMEFKINYLDRMEDVVESIDIETEEKNLKVMVLTWVPRQILTQSTGTIWTSCMSLSDYDRAGGSNKRFVTTGITEGVFIAWLVNLADMKTIKEPIARILIKPFVDKDKNIIWWPSTIYHDGGQGSELKLFERTCRSYMLKKQKDLIKKDMTIEINNTEKVYSDNDSDKRIVFYNRKIKPKEMDLVVDFNPTKIIDYIKNGDFDILKISNFVEITDYLIKLKNVFLIKLFLDRFLSNLNTSTSTYLNTTLSYLNNIFDHFDVFGDPSKIYENETFYTIFFKKIIAKNLDLKKISFSSKEKITSVALNLAKKNKFAMINELIQNNQEDLMFYAPTEKRNALLIINIINGNKLAFTSIANFIKSDKSLLRSLLVYFYLYRGYKEIDNFLKNYFSDINFEMIKEMANQYGQKFVLEGITKINEHLDDKNIKNVNYMLFKGLNEGGFFNSELWQKDKIKTFYNLFKKDFNFTDEQISNAIIDNGIFKIIFNNDNGNHIAQFKYLLESLIASGNKKLVFNLIENSNGYKIASILLDCDQYSYNKNIDLFNEMIELKLKIDPDSVFFASFVDYIKMYETHFDRKKLKNKTFNTLINNISEDSTRLYIFYIFLHCIDYDQNEIELFIKKYKINMKTLKEEIAYYMSRGSILKNLFECSFINETKTINFFESVNFFTNGAEELLSNLYVSTPEKIKFKIVNKILNANFETLDQEKIFRIFQIFFHKESELNEDEKRIYENLEKIVVARPEVTYLNINIELVNRLSKLYINPEKFLIKLRYPKLEDFLRSDLFKKLISKSKSTISRKKYVDEKDYSFISRVPLSLYRERIEEKMIPMDVLKMIKENKHMNEELEFAKKNAD